MANYTYTDHVGDGTTTTFPFSFVGAGIGYIKREHVYVYVNGSEATFTFSGTNQVTITPTPAVDDAVRIRRIMPKGLPYADFSRGNVFSQDLLNNSFLQSLYIYHEFLDGFLDSSPFKIQGSVEILGGLVAEGLLLSGDLDVAGNRIKNLPEALVDTDAVSLGQATRVAALARGANISQEEQPTTGLFNGLRWYKPSEFTTYVYYCDADSCQWVQEPVQSAEGTLRQELAATDSTVLVGGVEAGVLAKRSNSFLVINPAATGSSSSILQSAINASKFVFCAAGDWTFDAGITIPVDGVTIMGAGKNAVNFKRGASLGTANMFTGSGVKYLKISGIRFDFGKGGYTPALSDVYLENIINLFAPKEVDISGCAFDNYVNRAIAINAAVSDGAVNIKIYNNTSMEGSRGFISAVRYVDNIHIYGNELLNTVDSLIGGVPFEKSISVSGANNVFIYDNLAISTNGDSATIIVEYQERESSNVQVHHNSVTGSGGEQAYKIGPCRSVSFHNNYAKGNEYGLYLEGVNNADVYSNVLDACSKNALILAQDFDTGRFCNDVTIRDNWFVDANTSSSTAGVAYTSLGSIDSYAVWVQEGSANVNFAGNRYIDSFDRMGGILISSESYTIKGEDFTKLGATKVAVHNTFQSASAVYEISSCIGMATTASGVTTIPATVGNINVSPAIVSVFNPPVKLSINGFMSGNAAYVSYDGGIPPTFDIYARKSDHTAATTHDNIIVSWSVDVSKTAKNILGKTA